MGGGDSALEEAMFLTRFAVKVYLVHRRGSLPASKIMQDRAFANDEIEFVWNSEVVSINGEDQVESITVREACATTTQIQAAMTRDEPPVPGPTRMHHQLFPSPSTADLAARALGTQPAPFQPSC